MEQFSKILRRLIWSHDPISSNPQSLLRLSHWAFSTVENKDQGPWTRDEILFALGKFGSDAPEQELFHWLEKGFIIPAREAKHLIRFHSDSLRYLLAAYSVKDVGPTLFPQIIERSTETPWDEILCCLVQLLEAPEDLLSLFVASGPELSPKKRIRYLLIGVSFVKNCHFLDPKARNSLELGLAHLGKNLGEENIFALPTRDHRNIRMGDIKLPLLHGEILSNRFSDSELRTLCTYLEVRYENLPAADHSGKARELIEEMDRQRRLGELINTARKMRVDISWTEVYK